MTRATMTLLVNATLALAFTASIVMLLAVMVRA
jgi:hypothetical protein